MDFYEAESESNNNFMQYFDGKLGNMSNKSTDRLGGSTDSLSDAVSGNIEEEADAAPRFAGPSGTLIFPLDRRVVNNDPGTIDLPAGGKVVWFMRHGQSIGNVAKKAAESKDVRDKSGRKNYKMYADSMEYLDAPLSEEGVKQARAAQQTVATWKVKPQLIVCSPLTRAIQTAAIVYEQILDQVQLVVRPEMREFDPTMKENQGSTLPELRVSAALKNLSRWPTIQKALSEESTKDWSANWDEKWARGGPECAKHIRDKSRLKAFGTWLQSRPETHIATVSHFGTILKFMMGASWPIVNAPDKPPMMPNAGWVVVSISPEGSSALSAKGVGKSLGTGPGRGTPRRKRRIQSKDVKRKRGPT